MRRPPTSDLRPPAPDPRPPAIKTSSRLRAFAVRFRMMIFRTLGKTGWRVGASGFGAWGVGGEWGSVEDATAIDTIKAALDAGVNFFDTADAYGEPPGRSEELM